MRCSPAGMIASSLEEAEDLGQRTAEVTHNHPHTRRPQPAWPGRRIGSAPPPACAYYNGHAGRTKRHRPFNRRCLLCSVCRKSR
ncbi:MAG: ADP-ribosylglycohydrolase family protein [Oscillospiraceae bacterium]|nr:ADP-ribosylglycohydrolase family protein [Oscillospiraceae bacterium]